jgi:hypothetical protein
MTMAGGVSGGAPAVGGCSTTVCCGVVLSVPAALACALRRWIDAATSDCCPIIASPTF